MGLITASVLGLKWYWWVLGRGKILSIVTLKGVADLIFPISVLERAQSGIGISSNKCWVSRLFPSGGSYFKIITFPIDLAFD